MLESKRGSPSKTSSALAYMPSISSSGRSELERDAEAHEDGQREPGATGERLLSRESCARAHKDNEFKGLTGTGCVAVHLLLRRTEAGLAAVHGRRIRARPRPLLTTLRAPRVAFRPGGPGRPAAVDCNREQNVSRAFGSSLENEELRISESKISRRRSRRYIIISCYSHLHLLRGAASNNLPYTVKLTGSLSRFAAMFSATQV